MSRGATSTAKANASAPARLRSRAGAQRFTFMFGDLDPAKHVGDVIDAFLMYRDRKDGFLDRAERPEPLRAGILARIAPPGLVGTAGPRSKA